MYVVRITQLHSERFLLGGRQQAFVLKTLRAVSPMASEPGMDAALSPDASQLGAYIHSAMASEVPRLAALAAKAKFGHAALRAL